MKEVLRQLDGTEYQEVIGKLKYNKYSGKREIKSTYGKADLTYYLKNGFLKLANSASGAGRSSATEQAEGETMRLLVDNEHVEVSPVFDAASFDEFVGADEEVIDSQPDDHDYASAQLVYGETQECQVAKVTLRNAARDNNVTFQGYEQVGARQGFNQLERNPLKCTISNQLPYDDDVVVPGPDELEGYQGDGTYKDHRGDVHHSHHVTRTLKDYAKSVKQVVAESQRYVSGIPALLGMAALYGTVMSVNVGPNVQDGPVPKNMVEVPVPKGSRQAMSKEFYPQWHQATYEELSGLYDMGCMEYASEDDPRVKKSHVIPCHMVYTTKWDGSTPPKFLKCKGRCVAGGNHEPVPENVFEHFSPTAGPCINRLTDAYCVMKGYHCWTTDCTQAFLNSETTSDIFVRPPPGCGTKGYVWRLKKFLYGLKGAPAAWMRTLTTELTSHGFSTFDDDPCLLRRFDPRNNSEIIAEVFVDDVKWCTNDPDLLKTIICKIGDKYKISVGDTKVNSDNCHTVDWSEAEISTYLGMRYTRTMKDGFHHMTVDQTAYIEDIVRRFELDDTKIYKDNASPLPRMSSTGELYEKMGGENLSKDTEANRKLREWADKYSYPMIIGSLIHAYVHTRPDIGYAVSVLSRNMANPELHHYKAARYLLLYLRATKQLGIEYDQKRMLSQKNKVTASVMEEGDTYDDIYDASVDASFADDSENCRSTSGFVVWFCGSPVDYECKRQPLVTMSTMESEYVAASKCVLSVRFLHKFLRFIDYQRTGPTKIYEDNQACIAITDKPVHRARSKHIGVKYHNVREASQNGEVQLVYISTKHQVADLFTKSLFVKDFQRLRGVLMGHTQMDEMIKLSMQNEVKTIGSMSAVINLFGYSRCEDSDIKYQKKTLKEDSFWRTVLGQDAIKIPGYDDCAF